MANPIRTLLGTATHRLALRLYQDHTAAPDDRCARCATRTPCPVRTHAASVITAAGDDPTRYNTPDQARHHPPATSTLTDEAEQHTDHTGYRLGGRGQRGTPAGYLYEREP